MPLYEFSCSCGQREEVLRPVWSLDAPWICKKCGRAMRRVEFPGSTVIIEPVLHLPSEAHIPDYGIIPPRR